MKKIFSIIAAVLVSSALFATTYTVAGVPKALFGTEWDAANTANDMINNVGNHYIFNFQDVKLAKGTKIAFKVVQDHDFNIAAWPANNFDTTIVEGGIYLGAITFDADSKEIGIRLSKTGEAEFLENGFYLIGKSLDWNVENLTADLKFAPMENSKEYKLTTELALEDTIKVVKVENEAAVKWYPDGMGNGFGISEEYKGKHDIYFQEEYKQDWKDFGGYFWMSKNEKPQAPAHFFIAGTMTEWKPDSIEMIPGNDDSLSVKIALKADSLYQFKVVKIQGTDTVWFGAYDKGAVMKYGNCTGWGLKDKDNNDIGLQTTKEDEYEFIFDKTSAQISVVIPKPDEPTYRLENGFYLISAALDWNVENLTADLKFAPMENGKEYKLTVELALEDTIKVVKVEKDVIANWYPEGMGNGFAITKEYTGEHDIYFQEEKKDDWAAFGGYFWMGKNVEPVEEKEIKLVPYLWANDGAQIAAWVWNKDKSVETFTAFFKPINDGSDTLAAKVNVEADSIIFVRFSDKATEPKWNGGDGYQWNQTPNDSIQWESSVFTIIGCSGYNCNGTWERYIPEPPAKYYIVGDSAIVGSKEKEWQPDGLKSMTDTTVLNLQPGKFSMRLTLEGTWEGPQRDFRHLTDTAKGLVEYIDDYSNHNITFELKEAGEVKVIFIAASAAGQPEVFKLVGNFFVPEPGPQPEKEELLLVPYKWVEGEAKISAWIWGEKLEGHWTEYFAPIAANNDTLKAEIEATADSIIFVRFNKDAVDPKWDGGDGYIWDLMPKDAIDHDGLTFTVVDWREGTWKDSIPAEPVEIEDGYYLNGTIANWEVENLAPFKFVENSAKPGEYLVRNVTLVEGDEIKACKVVNNAVNDNDWYGVGKDGANNNLVVSAEQAGVRTVYFNTEWQSEWEGFIYVEVEATAVENTEATVKAVKTLRNGMLIIEKNGVRYNVLGTVIR